MSGGFWALWEAVDSTRRYLFSSDAAEGEEPASPVSGPAPAVRTAFGGRPRYTFQLTAAEGDESDGRLIQCYGEPDLSSFTSVLVGEPVERHRRLGLARQIFQLIDEKRRRELDSHQLQMALNFIGIERKAKLVLDEFSSDGTSLSMEEFAVFVASLEDAERMRIMIPLEMVEQVRSGLNLCVRRTGKKKGTVDREALKSFVEFMGLDWTNEDLDAYLSSHHRGVLHFLNHLAVLLRQGSEPGARTLRMRNWWLGRWYVDLVRDGADDKGQLYLYLENQELPDAAWDEVGVVDTAGSFREQPFLVGFRLEGMRYNVLITRLEVSRSAWLLRAARDLGVAPGMVSPSTVVDAVHAFHAFTNVTAMAQSELIEAVLRVVLGEVATEAATVSQAHLMVLLKCMGQHAEPQHITYLLLSRDGGGAPPSTVLSFHDTARLVAGISTSLAVPITYLKRLRAAWVKLDDDGDNALTMPQLRLLSALFGLGWRYRDIRMLLQDKPLKGRAAAEGEEQRMDWLQFLDAFVEIYGDPFFEKRYSELYTLLDTEQQGLVSGEDIAPILRSLPLNAEETAAALSQLMGHNLSVTQRQFAAGMFEADLCGATWPGKLQKLARAYLNIDSTLKGCVDAKDIFVVARKLGADFTLEQRNAVMRILDKGRSGDVSFGEFSTRRHLVVEERERCGELSSLLEVERLCQLTSYELATTIEELDEARDMSKRPALEKFAQIMITKSSKSTAAVLQKKSLRRRRQVGLHETPAEDPLMLPFELTRAARIWIWVICYSCIFRCSVYGLASSGFSLLCTRAADQYFPINEADQSGNAYSHWQLWVHYIIAYGPAVVLSFIEALVICYDFLATAVGIAREAKVPLYKDPIDPLRVFTARAITNSALELGNPNNQRFGIQPLRGSNKAILWFCGILYSLRAGLTKFLVKIIIRRVASRSAVRGASDLIALPIVAFWNGTLAATVSADLRCVTLGRHNITVCVDTILALNVELRAQVEAGVDLQNAVDLARARSHAIESPAETFTAADIKRDLRNAVWRTVAVAVVLGREFHPNMELIIKHLLVRLRSQPSDVIEVDDVSTYQMSCLPKLNTLDTYTVLSLLMLCFVVDGALSISQKVFFKRTVMAAGFEPSLAVLEGLLLKFNNIRLTPRDAAFTVFEMPEQMTEPELSLLDEAEFQLSKGLRFLSF